MRGRSGRLAVVTPSAIAAPVTVTDTDFAGGTPAGTEIASGSVKLKRGVLEDFAGAALPTGMTWTAWAPPAGHRHRRRAAIWSSTALVWSTTRRGPRRGCCEFRATFGAAAFQHIGFGDTFESAPWAMFSTGGTTPVALYARTNTGTPAPDQLLTGVDPLSPHDYKIEWTPTTVVYSVDGTVRHTETATFTQNMRPVISDLNAADGATVTVESMLRDRFPASGTLVSRVFDSGDSRAAWSTLTATPVGAGVTLATRSGNSATPDTSWSDWADVGAGGAIASPAGSSHAVPRDADHGRAAGDAHARERRHRVRRSGAKGTDDRRRRRGRHGRERAVLRR